MEMTVKDNKLIITAELGKGQVSASGKSHSVYPMVVASTHGFVTVPGTDYRVNLNVIK